MESVRSEKESEVKYSDEDDGNASESDSKDGSFISDMLPHNSKYVGGEQLLNAELDESNFDIED